MYRKHLLKLINMHVTFDPQDLRRTHYYGRAGYEWVSKYIVVTQQSQVLPWKTVFGCF